MARLSARKRVLVAGGGVAGLAAARALADRFDVVLVERDERTGGKLATSEFRGRPLDVGPDNFITRNEAAERLCRALGLGDDLLAPATSSAAVFARGRPRPLPKGLVLGVPTDLGALARSGIVGAASVLRAAADFVLPGSAASSALAARAAGGSGDPTIAEVVRPRLGAEVLANLVDPLLGGINAGDSRSLSFAAAAPQLASAAAGQRSLIRALRPRPEQAKRPSSPAASPLFLGLAGGLATLATALTKACVDAGVDVRLATAADRLERAAPGSDATWVLHCGGERIEADGIVLAVPAPEAGSLLEDVAPALAGESGEIAYSGVVTVTVAFPATAVPRTLAPLLGAPGAATAGAPAGLGTAAVLPGSGVLVPRSSRRLVTAATFTSTKWPRSANPGEAVIRASAGRDGDDRAVGLADDALVAEVRSDLEAVLGIAAAPLEWIVKRWPRSFPQYASGHLERVARLRELAGRLPALALAGAAYDGIGIPACIASGERAAELVAGSLS